ncbi:MAG: 1,4-dihydroxy-2-naphthoate polyprenyltransferase [Acidimicrobiia bacterium]
MTRGYQAWKVAARPRTLPAAVAPVLVGSGLAVSDGGFRWGALIAAMIGALALQIAANFANDVSDAKRGADAERIGPPRMVTAGIISPRQMWTATWLAVGVAALAGVYLIATAGWVVAAIGVASIVAMLGYVGGPIPYGYRGLGEVAVLVFFGFVATVGTRYVHDQTAPPDAWWMGAVMGMLAAAILVANNLRDLDTDTRVDKRTLAVMLGRPRARALYTSLVFGSFVLIALGPIVGVTHPLTALACMFVGLSVPLIRTARTETEAAPLIPLLAGTARLQLLVGIALAAAAAAA